MTTLELDIIHTWSQTIVDEIYREWNIRPVKGNAEAAAQIGVFNGDLVVDIIGKGQKAWILEYGKGSLIDADNPYLQEYVASEIFNSLRSTTTFETAGRAKGQYQDLDGNLRYTTGQKAGIGLEGSHSKYAPQPALHIIRNSVLQFLPFIVEDLSDAAVRDYMSNLPDLI